MTREPQFCTCGKQLAHNPRRKTNLCQRCATAASNRDPVAAEKRGVALRIMHTDPELKARHRAGVIRAWESRPRRRAASELMKGRYMHDAAMREHIRQKAIERWSDPANRARHGRIVSASKLRDIPLEYRDEYRRLRKHGGFTAAEARRMIADQVEADTRTYLKTGKLPKTGATG